MKKMITVAMLLFMVSCGGTTKRESTAEQTGWTDDDTYTVQTTEANEVKAVDKARHQILKDIVDVRMRNNSRYTDIEKIREEFNIPLSNGIIIRRNTVPEGMTIYFQIREKGLKKKFQRK
jgi:hypothetical protein